MKILMFGVLCAVGLMLNTGCKCCHESSSCCKPATTAKCDGSCCKDSAACAKCCKDEAGCKQCCKK
jgi:hypothetical protein